jgi:hypothetical protein
MHLLMNIFLAQVYFTCCDTNIDFNPAMLLIITFFKKFPYVQVHNTQRLIVDQHGYVL